MCIVLTGNSVAPSDGFRSDMDEDSRMCIRKMEQYEDRSNMKVGASYFVMFTIFIAIVVGEASRGKHLRQTLISPCVRNGHCYAHSRPRSD